MDFLKSRIGLLDGVVLSGGECCLFDDVYDFIKKIKEMGFLVKIDTNGTNAKLIKKLVNDYNSNSKGFVAFAYKNGNGYSIGVVDKNSQTVYKNRSMEKAKSTFDYLKAAFNKYGIDFEDLIKNFPSLFDVTNIKTSLSWMESLAKTKNTLLMQGDVEFLLNFASDEQKSRLISKYGSLKSAAEAYYNHIKGIGTPLTTQALSLLDSSINTGKKYNGAKIAEINKDIESNQEDTETKGILKTINELHKKYGINSTSTIVLGQKIKSLSDAAAKAVVILNRKLKDLESQSKVNKVQTEELKGTIKEMVDEISKNRYAGSVMKFLGTILDDINSIDKLFENIEGVEGTKEYNYNMAAAVMKASSIIESYSTILDELSILDSKVIDEDLNLDMKEGIINQAKALHDVLRKKVADVEAIKESTMLGILTDIFGDNMPDNRDVTTLLTAARQDASIMDFLFAYSRCSNPIIAAMGGITRSAQDERNQMMADYSVRIQKATDKLRKAGHFNTKWMYTWDEDGNARIISPYNWEAFNAARVAFKKECMKRGIFGQALKDAMEEDYKNMTQEVVVDEKTGRTERVPIDDFKYEDGEYANPFTHLDDAQKEYYKEIMEIKAELGSLLPEYAQDQYLPPQVRRELSDVPLKELPKSIWERFKNYWKREGDEEVLNKNVIFTNDEKFMPVEGLSDDTVKKQIPIFYTKKVNQDELLLDFSGAMSNFARTATNYYCMNKVLDVVRFMGDFVSSTPISEQRMDITTGETVNSYKTTIIQRLFKHAKGTNTQSLVEGLLDTQFYNIRLKNANKWYVKYLKSLMQYTSFRMLSTNVFGAASNAMAGEYQMLLEATGGENMNVGDLLWAQGVMFGNKVTNAPGKMMDVLLNNTTSFETLLANRFDPLSEKFDELGRKRFDYNPARKLFRESNSFALYGMGENLIHYTVMYAVLHHEKILINGKQQPLYKALKKSEKTDGNNELELVDGVTTLDGKPLTDIHDEYFDDIKRKVRQTNQECHGAMSQEERGAISQYMTGRLVMQMRQWMVEHYSRRYRGLHYDGSSDTWREGWYITAYKNFIKGTFNDVEKMSIKARITFQAMNNVIDEYNKEKQNRTLSDSAFKALEQEANLARLRKANIKKFYAEIGTLALLLALSCVVFGGDDNDYDDYEWFERFNIYLLKRLTTEAIAATPVGVISETKNIVKNPVASLTTASGLLYPILGLGDITREYETGKYAGENVYVHKVLNHTFPVYKDVRRVASFMEGDNSLIGWVDPNYQLTR